MRPSTQLKSTVRRQALRLPGLVALVLWLLLLLNRPATAFAHAYPVRSEPAPNATLPESPSLVEIWFSERLEPALSGIAVYNAEKQPVQAQPSQVDPRDSRHLLVRLRPHLPRGTYTVVWHAVSADDGHSTAGVFAFGVGESAQPPVVSAQALGAARGNRAGVVGVIGRWLVYLGSVVVLGTAAFVRFIVLPATRGTGADAVDPIRSDGPAGSTFAWLVSLALAVLLLGQALRLADEAALSAGGQSLPGQGALAVLLFDSRLGTLWLGRSGLLAVGVLLVILGRARRQVAQASACRSLGESPWLWVGVLGVGTGLVTDLALSGHAAAGSLLAYASLAQATLGWAAHDRFYFSILAALIHSARTITLAVDWLHLLAVSVWIGGLITLATAARVLAQRAGTGTTASIGPIAGRFSRLAAGGLITVLISGLYNTWLYLAGPASYLDTGYGQSLLLKHIAVVALLLAAALNRVVTVPVLTGRRKLTEIPALGRRLIGANAVRLVYAEAGLGLLVLLSTGLLTSLGPARSPRQILLDPPRELALATEPFQTTLSLASDEQAQLEISPGRVGANSYGLRVRKGNRPAQGSQRAYLELTPLGLTGAASNVVRLTAIGRAEFAGRGLELSTPGIWRITVLVYHADGRITSGQTFLQVTSQWGATVESGVPKLLAEAEEAMNRLHSAAMVESLSDGAAGLALTRYRFGAPDRERIASPDGGAMIQIGPTVYYRHAGATSWSVERGATPYRWPSDVYGYLREGVGGVNLGERSVGDHACTVVAFYSPPAQAIYEEWIGIQDHLIYQEVMFAPAHDMVNRYDSFDRARPIQPPV